MEVECTERWRSFDPKNTCILKVKDIPAFCYLCGSVGHYGTECGIPSRISSTAETKTWTQANREQYVDPESPNVAVAWIGVDLNGLAKSAQPDFHIRGRAVRPTHVHFVSSDDSDEEFIHAPLQRAPQRGEIRMARNLGVTAQPTGQQREARGDAGHRSSNMREFPPPPPPPNHLSNVPLYPQPNGAPSWQPPLPPGPPPPPMTSNDFQPSGLPQAPPGSLPQRPEVSFVMNSGRPPPERQQRDRNRIQPRGRGGGRNRPRR